MSNKLTYIVFADDDPDDQFLIQSLLREISPHIIVYPVYNGRQLIEFLEKQYDTNKPLPHFIITDLNMPVMNGFEAIKHIKELKTFSDIPIYVLTTCSEEKTKSISLELGAKQFHTKPDNSFMLRELLETILTNQAQHHASMDSGNGEKK